MTIEEAIKTLEVAIAEVEWEYPMNYDVAIEMAITALRAQQEAGTYRFYYCESENSYLLGARVGNFYYAHWDGKSFTWDMSRFLPWGKHITIPDTAWKEHTFPSEPQEIGPDKWFCGFLAQQEAEKDDPQGGWISVKDRLPPNYIPVLCYIPSLASQILQVVHECHIGPDGEWHSATAPAYREEVTHWMPLPEPPKEDTK